MESEEAVGNKHSNAQNKITEKQITSKSEQSTAEMNKQAKSNNNQEDQNKMKTTDTQTPYLYTSLILLRKSNTLNETTLTKMKIKSKIQAYLQT